jgi:hypothetical protein
MNEKERKALRALCEKATRGPWEVTHYGGIIDIYAGPRLLAEVRHLNPENGQLIAASRTAVPALLDRVEALEKALRSVITDNAQDSIEDPIGHAERWAHSTGVVFKGTLDRISVLLAPPAGTDKGEP